VATVFDAGGRAMRIPWRLIGPPLFYTIALACWLTSAEPASAIDNSRFCSATAPNIVLYLDVTTPYDDVDKETLVDGATRIFESLKGGERISIRTIADEFSSSRRLLDLCVPYCESHGFLPDLFSDCTEGVVINEKKRVKASIAAELRDAMSTAGNLPYSEIVRTLSLSANEEYRTGRENDFYIFSDLIENSKYLPGKKFLWEPADSLLAVVRKDGLIPKLAGASVKVFGLGRGGNPGHRDALPQDVLERVESFWRSYFTDAGASLTMQQNLTLN
jgi:hypothetical protein